MKGKGIATIIVCIGFITIAFIGWQFSEWTQYNKLLSHKAAQPFKASRIGIDEQQFIDEVISSWKIVAQIGPDKDLEDDIKKIGFEGNVSGLVKLFTVDFPSFSNLDIKRNRRFMEIGGSRMMMALRPPSMTYIEPELFHREGFIYVKMWKGLIQVYEDREDGVHGVMYVKQSKTLDTSAAVR